MTVEELLSKLKINNNYKEVTDAYEIEISNSDEYGKIYSKLDKSSIISEDDAGSSVSIDNSTIKYVTDDATITMYLIADFDNDTYKLKILNK